MDPIYIIFIISVIGPILGSLLGVIKKPSEIFTHNMLAFAAGVMLAVSFLQLIPKSISLSSIYLSTLGIIIGATIIYFLDKVIPHVHPELAESEKCLRLGRTAKYLMAGIFLHNFPEGMAIAIGTVTDLKVGLTVALAISLQKIPEGICTSAPYYYCTRKRLKSFLISCSTMIPLIIGIIFASYLFQNISLKIVGLIIAATAGIMIYISADELIPTSCSKANKTWSQTNILSLMAGVLVVVLLGTLQ